eukprot:gene6877-11039_t
MKIFNRKNSKSQDPNSLLKKHFSDIKGEVNITTPKDFKSIINVKYDQKDGTYSGLPKEWRHAITIHDC